MTPVAQLINWIEIPVADIDAAGVRADTHGGELLQGRTNINEFGFYAVTAGNHVTLHGRT